MRPFWLSIILYIYNLSISVHWNKSVIILHVLIFFICFSALSQVRPYKIEFMTICDMHSCSPYSRILKQHSKHNQSAENMNIHRELSIQNLIQNRIFCCKSFSKLTSHDDHLSGELTIVVNLYTKYCFCLNILAVFPLAF